MKVKKIALTILVILCLCLAVSSAALAMSSSSYQLPWQSVSVGGGNRSSENYTLQDTVGQSSAIGFSESANYSLEAGYWYGASELSLAPSVSGCFIATAAYGSYLDSHVDTLRNFRDQYLMTNPVGRSLVYLYYELSPPVAEFIQEHPTLKPFVRVGLLPAVAVSTIALNTTLAEKIAIAGLLALVCFVLAAWAKKWRGKYSQHYQG